MEQRRRSAGFSLVELLIVIAIILVILTIAIPNYQSQKRLTNEMAALGELQTLYVAQTQFFSQQGRYAASLEELGPTGAKLIPKILAAGTHHGYRFAVTAGSQSGFAVGAVPISFGSTGSRTFYMDEMRTVHQNGSAEPATADSPEVP
ncbi:hypothetical protein F183_A03290 [Bryobacterales bacterium F-183]|nr:hypothetical protein F183_A03290 [Bryobacterales bacterium F-183]